MLTKNFHTHTYRCHHAEGTEREYVEKAIEGGMKALGFSDHSPYVFDDGYYSNFRMLPDEIENYVRTLLDLKDEYKNEIEIHVGFEAEYYPKFFERFLRLIEPFPIEYLILGQHFLFNETDPRVPTLAGTGDEAYLEQYVNQVTEAISTGVFTYVAHPDVFYFKGDEDTYAKHMKKLLVCAKENEIPLEINLLGIRTNRIYPCAAFWKAAGEVGNEVVFGSDAHRAEDVCDFRSAEVAHLITKKYDLKRLDAPKLICPFHRKG